LKLEKLWVSNGACCLAADFSLEWGRGHGFNSFGFGGIVGFNAVNGDGEHTAVGIVLESVSFELTTRHAGNDFTTATFGNEGRWVALGIGTMSLEVSGKTIYILSAVQRSDVVISGVVTSVEETVVVVFVTDKRESFRGPRPALNGTIHVHRITVFNTAVVERQPHTDTVDKAGFAVFDGTTCVSRCVLGEGIFQGGMVVLCGTGQQFGLHLDQRGIFGMETEGSVTEFGFSRTKVSLGGSDSTPEQCSG